MAALSFRRRRRAIEPGAVLLLTTLPALRWSGGTARSATTQAHRLKER